MCGFAVSDNAGIQDTNERCQRRGPDRTDVQQYHDIWFLHNLLHITGDITPQPLYKDDCVLVFNGEIYNYRDFGNYASDAPCILDLYCAHGAEAISRLDGEFALCIVDFRQRRIVLATDTFATKPLWYRIDSDTLVVASYQSQILGLGVPQAQRLPANTTLIYDLDHRRLVQKLVNFEFDIQQHRTSYDHWVQAWKASIHKRSHDVRVGMFLGLSSGYDSGAIACELQQQARDFHAFSITNRENLTVLDQRLARLARSTAFDLEPQEYRHWQDQLRHCEDFRYNDGYRDYDIKRDKASMGLAAVCDRARAQGLRIYLSGQGADEIISDYGHGGRKIFGHSGFGGQFPEDLRGFWPWHSFWNGTQIQYLNKEEYVAGHFGIETRYPFLDRDLVQEFLWLRADLKNRRYKSVLHHYLEQNQWPFQPGEKLGFSVAPQREKRR